MSKMSTHCTDGANQAVGLGSHNEKVTEAGLEPGSPDPWPMAYSKQNFEELVGGYWDRGKRAPGSDRKREWSGFRPGGCFDD